MFTDNLHFNDTLIGEPLGNKHLKRNSVSLMLNSRKDRLDAAQVSLFDTKGQVRELSDRLQRLQLEHSEESDRRAELQTQVRHLTSVASDRQASNDDLQTRLLTAQSGSN